MSVVNPHIRFVYEDYKALPESMARQYELLDGEILMVPAPTTRHQLIAGNIHAMLHVHARRSGLGVVLSPPIDVVFGEGDAREIVQPDVLFVSRPRYGIIVEAEVRGAPDLVVEVLSPSTATRDLTYKKHLYGRYGVREYWIVDPILETLDLYASKRGSFDQPRTMRASESFSSALFEGLVISLEDVFQLR